MDACEILTKSIDVFKGRGWCKGMREDADGRVCAYGAIAVALTGNPNGTLPRSGSAEAEPLMQVKEALGAAYEDDPVTRRFPAMIIVINEAIIKNTDEAIAWFERAKERVC